MTNEDKEGKVTGVTADSVAFQGEIGAFSYSAIRKLLGPDIAVRPTETFRQVFELLAQHKVQYALIPIENTLYGSLHENYDYLLKFDMNICGETTLRISHNLITRPNVSIGKIRRAFSHPVALDQCRRFFEENQQIQPIPFYDTAGSVKMLLAEEMLDAAAIASETAAEYYGGQVLVRGIEDNRDNFTRFFLLTKQPSYEMVTSDRGPWKTSIAFVTSNVAGALFKALACFSLRDLNLTKLESRPLRDKPWEYLFYVDIAGSVNEPSVAKALTNLEEITSFLKVLGSYQPIP